MIIRYVEHTIKNMDKDMLIFCDIITSIMSRQHIILLGVDHIVGLCVGSIILIQTDTKIILVSMTWLLTQDNCEIFYYIINDSMSNLISGLRKYSWHTIAVDVGRIVGKYYDIIK